MFIEEINRLERQDAFILKAKQKYQNKFNYSKVHYTNSITKVIFICNKHNIEFKQSPVKHLQTKHCCPLCAKEAYSKAVRITKDKFIEFANKVHGDKFSYEHTILKRKTDMIEIYCKKHKHSFKQQLSSHLKGFNGCKLCIKEQQRTYNNDIFTKNFIDSFVKKFGNHYDFSKVDYVNNTTPVVVYCKKHNLEFNQVHRNIKRGQTCSCPMCKKSH